MTRQNNQACWAYLTIKNIVKIVLVSRVNYWHPNFYQAPIHIYQNYMQGMSPNET